MKMNRTVRSQFPMISARTSGFNRSTLRLQMSINTIQKVVNTTYRKDAKLELTRIENEALDVQHNCSKAKMINENSLSQISRIKKQVQLFDMKAQTLKEQCTDLNAQKDSLIAQLQKKQISITEARQQSASLNLMKRRLVHDAILIRRRIYYLTKLIEEDNRHLNNNLYEESRFEHEHNILSLQLQENLQNISLENKNLRQMHSDHYKDMQTIEIAQIKRNQRQLESQLFKGQIEGWKDAPAIQLRKKLLSQQLARVIINHNVQKRIKQSKANELCFGQIKQASGISDPKTIANKFFESERTYKSLIDSVSTNQKKIKNLIQTKKKLLAKLEVHQPVTQKVAEERMPVLKYDGLEHRYEATFQRIREWSDLMLSVMADVLERDEILPRRSEQIGDKLKRIFKNLSGSLVQSC